jgi:uncharacterized protein
MAITAGSERLHDAIKEGDTTTVRALLQNDRSLAAARGPDGISALLRAMYHGRRELVSLLAPHVQPDVHEAAAIGDLPRLCALADAEPESLRSMSADGWTPLHLAAFFADVDVVDALLARRADTHARSKNGTANTPLHAAIAGRCEPAVIRRLVEAGSDVNATSEGGWTPLQLAASRGSVALIDYLLAHGADPSTRSDSGRTAAEIAEERSHPEAAARLRAAGAHA